MCKENPPLTHPCESSTLASLSTVRVHHDLASQPLADYHYDELSLSACALDAFCSGNSSAPMDWCWFSRLVSVLAHCRRSFPSWHTDDRNIEGEGSPSATSFDEKPFRGTVLPCLCSERREASTDEPAQWVVRGALVARITACCGFCAVVSFCL